MTIAVSAAPALGSEIRLGTMTFGNGADEAEAVRMVGRHHAR
jgi:hypothetical protein